MMELTELIMEVKRDGKINSDSLIAMLSEAIEDASDPICVYKDVYKKAYGEHLSESLCRDWVMHMDVTDNSERKNGEKWSYDQTTDVGNKIGMNWSKITKWEWYVILNGAYSDYYSVGAEYQVADDPIFFALLAKAFWCDDKDAHGKSIASYYFDYVM